MIQHPAQVMKMLPAAIAAIASSMLLLAPGPACADGEEDEEDKEEASAEQDDEGEEAGDEAEPSDAKLVVPVSEDGARVILDGEEVGLSPVLPITGLTVGEHVIEVQKEGFKPYWMEVQIPEDGLVRHDVLLAGGKGLKHPVPKFLKAWWFWTAVGVVVGAGVGVGIYFGVKPEEPDAVRFPPY